MNNKICGNLFPTFTSNIFTKLMSFARFIPKTVIKCFFLCVVLIPPPVERCAARGRSVVRCTGWRTATCGAPPAAGKRPARDSPTDCTPSRQRHLKGDGSVVLHASSKQRNCPSSSGSAPLLLPAVETREGWQRWFFLLFFNCAVQES